MARKTFREHEGWFTLKDGTSLFEKTWEPIASPTAHLIFLHGFSDRSELHYTLFPTLSSQPYNITIHAIDQRGWGKSVHHPSQRGLTGPTPQVLTDVDEYIGFVHSKTKGLGPAPIFLMGHSMGGQILLHYLLTLPTSQSLTHRSKISAAILASPYISLHHSSQPWQVTIALGRIAAKLSPRTQMKQNLEWRYISRDLDVGREWRDDILCHGYGTLEGLSAMLDRAAVLEQLGSDSGLRGTGSVLQSKISVPVFWVHGTADRVTEFESSKRLFERLTGNTKAGSDGGDMSGNEQDLTLFKPYVDAYHKIHAEPDGVGVAFARDLGTWCLRVVDSLNDNKTKSFGMETAVDDGAKSSLKEQETSEPEPLGKNPGQDGEGTGHDKVKAKL